MSTKGIAGTCCIDAKHKVILYRHVPACRSTLDGPVQVSPVVPRQGESIVQFCDAAGVGDISEDRLLRGEPFEVQPVLVTTIEEADVTFQTEFADVLAVHIQLRYVAGSRTIKIIESTPDIEPVVRNVLYVQPKYVGIIQEPRHAEVLRQNVWRK